jgi:antirestriction protein ArdC
LSWRPDLPEPQPAYVEPGEPDPVSLEALRDLRDLCAAFTVPPRQFRRRTAKGEFGAYYPSTDIVAVSPWRAAGEGMGGDDGYYAALLHELLHATGHPRRLGRRTTGDFSSDGYALEEGTVLLAEQIVLESIGFDPEAVDWYTMQLRTLPADRKAASRAAGWVLR